MEVKRDVISALVLPSVLARPSSPGYLDSQITAEDASSSVSSCSHLALSCDFMLSSCSLGLLVYSCE